MRYVRPSSAALILAAGWCALSCSDSTAPAATVLPPFGSAEGAAVESLWVSALFATVIGAFGNTPGRTTSGTSLFANSVRGGTFIFDCASGRYLEDTTLIGAPPTGVRIEVYAVDDTYQPYCPLFPMAYLDLADVSDTSPALEVVIRDLIPNIEHMHFTVRAPRAGTSGSLTVRGMISDGVHHYSFAGARDHILSYFHHTAATLTRVETGAELQMTLDTHDSLADGLHVGTATTVDLVVSKSGQQIRMTGVDFGCDTCATEVRSFGVAVDGRPFGTVVYQSDSVTFTGPGSRVMTASEQEAMGYLQGAIYGSDVITQSTTALLAQLLPTGVP